VEKNEFEKFNSITSYFEKIKTEMLSFLEKNNFLKDYSSLKKKLLPLQREIETIKHKISELIVDFPNTQLSDEEKKKALIKDLKGEIKKKELVSILRKID